MAISHGIASGMGGMRTAGDLVARMQMSRGLRIDEAKQYVAEKLGTAVADLADPIVMSEVREDLRLGRVNLVGGAPKGMDAKFRIADVLGIDINCVDLFKRNAGLIT
jgi:dimethylamine--corrinoid protein Co-methyltransferase